MKGVSTGEELLLSFEVGSSSSASKPDDDVSTFAAEVEYAGAEADRITLLNPATCFCAGAASGSGRTLGACGVAPSSLEGVADDCAVGVVAVPSIVVVVSNYIEIKRVGSQCTDSTPVKAFLECIKRVGSQCTVSTPVNAFLECKPRTISSTQIRRCGWPYP